MVREAGNLAPEVLERMLDSSQPGPLRLLAAEALLQNGEDPRAVDAVREVARLPNREIAIAAAVIVQKWLRVDMGLPLGQPPPPPQSKPGAEVTRRVMQWAAHRPTPSSPSLPSIAPRKSSVPPTPVDDVPPVLTETPIPQPTPWSKGMPAVDDSESASADHAAAADRKTPWVW